MVIINTIINNYQWAGTIRGRKRLGWIDGVKVAFGNRGMTVEVARQCAKDRKEWRALVHMQLSSTRLFMLGPVFFRTALPCSGGYHLEMGCCYMRLG